MIAALVATIALTSPSLAYAEIGETPSDDVSVAAKVAPAVVCIDTRTDEGNAITGSGFFIAPRWVASSAHQLEKAKDIRIHMRDDRVFAVSRLILSKDKDVALLEIDTPQDDYLPLLPDNRSPTLGEAVFTIGCPYGLEHSLSRGVISHEGRMLNGKELIQTDVQVGFGSSGGPLVDKTGTVIGVFHGILKAAGTISFVIPIAELKDIMLTAGLSPSRLRYPDLYALWDKAVATPDPMEQKRLYDLLIDKAPWMAEAYYNRGLLAFNSQNYGIAQADFLKALEVRPAYKQALFSLGYAYFKEEKFKEARDSMLELIALDAPPVTAFYLLGHIYDTGLKDKNSARESFTLFIEKASDGPERDEVALWLKNH